MLCFTSIQAQSLKSLKEKATATVQSTSVAAKAKAEQMAKDLKLTADQKTKVETFFTKQDASLAKLKTEAKVGSETYKTKLAALTASGNAELEKIIGKEKLQQYQAKLAAGTEKAKTTVDSKLKSAGLNVAK